MNETGTNQEENKQENQPLPPPVRGPEPPAQFQTQLRWIGPEEANKILTESQYQRKHSRSTVSKYARDMKAGKWEFNASPIRYNGEEEGNPQLLDGQHRLRAVIEANMVMPFLVISGIEKDSIRTMDDGKMRSLAQKFYIDGEKSPDVLASMIQLLAVYRAKGKFSGPAFSSLEYYDVLNREGNSARQLAKEYKCKMPRNLKPGLIAAAHLLFAEKDPELAARFCGDVVSGDSDRGTPAREFREWVVGLEKGDVKTNVIATVLIDCWNRECRGDSITRIRIPKYCPEIGAPTRELQLS
jgi:hypothetical protein